MINKTSIKRIFKLVPYSLLSKAKYNRPINKKKVDRIVENFREDEVRPVIVSRHKDGSITILDGQHTAKALSIIYGNDCLVWCDIREGLSYEEEANLFVRLNTDINLLGKPDEIRGRIESNETDAVAFKKYVEAAGYTLFGGSNPLTAITTAYKIYSEKCCGGTFLTNLLSTVDQIWPDNSNATNAAILKGIRNLLVYNKDQGVDRVNLVKKLRKKTPAQLVAEGKENQKTMINTSSAKGVYLAIVATYNARLSPEKKLYPAMP